MRAHNTPRAAWASVGVVYDDITGGLTAVGIVPEGWVVPPVAPVTLVPRVLAGCKWPSGHGHCVFVTENPSVLGAAAGIPEARIMCTAGTPSAIEVAAIARLAEAGWQLHVRADFDDAGISHVNAILAAARCARPWRMGVSDYRGGLHPGDFTVPLRIERLAATPWEPDLRPTMVDTGVAVYEEALLDDLLRDIEEEC